MNADGVVYLDTSAVAKWYLNEPGSEQFVEFIQAMELIVYRFGV